MTTWTPPKYAEGDLPHLEALGRRLLELRDATGWGRDRVAVYAGVKYSTIHRIETAQNRTRQSTLARIVRVLVEADPTLGDADALTAELVALAGPALAPESVYAAKIAKRRDRRVKRMRELVDLGASLEAAWWETRPYPEGRP